MLKWAEVGPLLTVFFTAIAGIFGYAWAGRERAKGLAEAAKPTVAAAIGGALVDQKQLELVNTNLESIATLLVELVEILRAGQAKRTEDELVDAIIARLASNGVVLKPRTRPPT